MHEVTVVGGEASAIIVEGALIGSATSGVIDVRAGGRLQGVFAACGKVDMTGGTLVGALNAAEFEFRGGTLNGNVSATDCLFGSTAVFESGQLSCQSTELIAPNASVGGVITTSDLLLSGRFELSDRTSVFFDTVRLSGGLFSNTPAIVGLDLPFIIDQPEFQWNGGRLGGPAGVIVENTTVVTTGGIIDGHLTLAPSSTLQMRSEPNGDFRGFTVVEPSTINLGGTIDLRQLRGSISLPNCEITTPLGPGSVRFFIPPGAEAIWPWRVTTSVTFLSILRDETLAEGGTLVLVCGAEFRNATTLIGSFQWRDNNYVVPFTSLFVFNGPGDPVVVREDATLAAFGATDFFGNFQIEETARVVVGNIAELANHGVFKFFSSRLTIGDNSRFWNLGGLDLPAFADFATQTPAVTGTGLIDNRFIMKWFGTQSQGVTVQNYGQFGVQNSFLSSVNIKDGRLEQFGELFVKLRFSGPAISVGRDATLSGRLELALPDGFLQDTRLFEVLRSHGREGVFDSVNQPFGLLYTEPTIDHPGAVFAAFPGLPTIESASATVIDILGGGQHLTVNWVTGGSETVHSNVQARLELEEVSSGERLLIGSTQVNSSRGFKLRVPDGVGAGNYRVRVSLGVSAFNFPDPPHMLAVVEPLEEAFTNVFTIAGSGPRPRVTLNTPGAPWLVGSAQTLSWGAVDPVGNVTIRLVSQDEESFEQSLAAVPMSDASVAWQVPANAPPGRYRFEILSDDSPLTRDVSEVFRIADSLPLPTLTSTTSRSSTVAVIWPAGTTQSITWLSNAPAGVVEVGLWNVDAAGSTFLGTIGQAAMADDRFDWNIPICLEDGNYRVTLRVAETEELIDGSDITITGAVTVPSIQVTAPDAVARWETRSTQTIAWNVADALGEVSWLLVDDDGDPVASVGRAAADALSLDWAIPAGIPSGLYTLHGVWMDCPTANLSVGSVPFEIIEVASGDFEGDGDSDLRDFGGLQACFTGACVAPPCDPALYSDPVCAIVDFDFDGAVDASDFATLQLVFPGPGG